MWVFFVKNEWEIVEQTRLKQTKPESYGKMDAFDKT